VNGVDWYEPLPSTLTVELDTGFVSQPLVSSGPKTSNVMTPPGLLPPDNWAVSKIEPPTATGGDAVVVTLVAAWLIVTISAGSPQELVTGRLLASPLYDATQM
jgi:hypothetical protein